MRKLMCVLCPLAVVLIFSIGFVSCDSKEEEESQGPINMTSAQDYFQGLPLKELPSEIRIPANNENTKDMNLATWVEFLDSEKMRTDAPAEYVIKGMLHTDAEWVKFNIIDREHQGIPQFVFSGEPNRTGTERRATVEIYTPGAMYAKKFKFEIVQNAKDEVTCLDEQEISPFGGTCTITTNFYCGVRPQNTDVTYQYPNDRQYPNDWEYERMMMLQEEKLAVIGEHVFRVGGNSSNNRAITFEVSAYDESGEMKHVDVIAVSQKAAFTVNVNQLSMWNGDSQTITCKNNTNYPLSMWSQDPSVATINNEGVVTAVGSGKTNIVIWATDGENGLEKEIPVTVNSVEDYVDAGCLLLNFAPYFYIKNNLSETINCSYSITIDNSSSKTGTLVVASNREEKFSLTMNHGTHSVYYTVSWTYKGKQYYKNGSQTISF
jgi:hypothetical protein